MFLRKFWHFIVQGLFLPISLALNFLVISPIFFISWGFTDGVPNNSLFISIIGSAICLPLGVFLSMLFAKLKGRKTDYQWEEVVWYVEEKTTEFYLGDEKIGEVTTTSDPKSGIVTRRALTGWGWFSAVTSLISFPLRVIAFLASFVALFIDSVYSTYMSIQEEDYCNDGNVVLHALFDFVVVPVHISGQTNLKGLAFVPLYILELVVVNLGTFFILSEVATNNFPDALLLLNFFIMALFVIAGIVLIIKNTIIVCKNFSVKNGFRIALKYLLVILIPTIIAVLSVLIFR
ncbi:MAG: hypothetical protein IJD47_05840 [Clostridia bacterium]|nr:hypothetical protein [Clostridia bacterium]